MFNSTNLYFQLNSQKENSLLLPIISDDKKYEYLLLCDQLFKDNVEKENKQQIEIIHCNIIEKQTKKEKTISPFLYLRNLLKKIIL